MSKNLRIHKINEADIETVMQEDAHFEGHMNVIESALIKGVIKGDIMVQGHLFVGETARLTAKIKARTMSLKGVR